MQKILWIGDKFFVNYLTQCGWQEVYCINPADCKKIDWPQIFANIGFTPDVIVVASRDPRFILSGIEKADSLTVLYCSDSQLYPWQSSFAQAFDACMVGKCDQTSDFEGPYLPESRIWWSPPFASDKWQPNMSVPAESPGIFVQKNRPETTAIDIDFWQALSKEVPGLRLVENLAPGDCGNSQLIVNHSAGPDLEFDVLEHMGAGACLVTPRLAHGLEKLFVDGEHYVGYAPADAGDAAYRIQFLLDNPDLCEYIGNRAGEEIASRHRPIHRAETFTDHICDLALNDPAALIGSRMARAEAIRKEYLEPASKMAL